MRPHERAPESLESASHLNHPDRSLFAKFRDFITSFMAWPGAARNGGGTRDRIVLFLLSQLRQALQKQAARSFTPTSADNIL
jgi:hypothetical protein